MKTRLTELEARLKLTPTQMAAYLGVPVFTYRKWKSGERVPTVVLTRLLDVLGTVEVLNPALHAQFLPGKG